MAYQPRTAESQVLHAVVRDHLGAFLRETSARSDGAGLPDFVEREFGDFLTSDEVARVLATIVRRLLQRRGVEDEHAGDPTDPLAEESLALAALATASVQGRIATGHRAGRRVLQLGREPDAP